jgi:hypothetical protein
MVGLCKAVSESPVMSREAESTDATDVSVSTLSHTCKHRRALSPKMLLSLASADLDRKAVVFSIP